MREESGVASLVKPLDFFLFDLLFFGAFLSFLVESYPCVCGR